MREATWRSPWARFASIIVGFTFFFNAFALAAANVPASPTALNPHPRLYWRDVAPPVEARRSAWRVALEAEAAALLRSDAVEKKTDRRGNMLAVSREALRRIPLLAGVYRLGRDARHLAAAKRELLAAAAFPDWGAGKHFLDAAEMATAVAIGYDWLHAELTPRERRTLRHALVEHALKPGEKALQDGASWTKAAHNWNLVCNGGLGVAALAVAEDEPQLAARVLALGRASMAHAWPSFAPDGGWMEGPDYWNYATRYATFYLAALQTAFTQRPADLGEPVVPGLAETGAFWRQMAGPTGALVNFADAPAQGTQTGAAQLLWLAEHFQRPAYAVTELATERPTIFHWLWAAPPGAAPPPLPLDALFVGAGVAAFRGAWNDARATYVTLKGGDNAANHSHLDLGSFVLDAAGQRWSVDPGRGDYALPGYFSTKAQRWTHFPTRTEAHSTLLIDGANQDPKAQATLVRFAVTADRSEAAFDLTKPYGDAVTSFVRTARLVARRVAEIDDRLTLVAPATLTWQMLTRAKVVTRGRTAVLSQGGETLTVTLKGPENAVFSALPAPDGLTRLTAAFRASGDVHVLVRFSP